MDERKPSRRPAPKKRKPVKKASPQAKRTVSSAVSKPAKKRRKPSVPLPAGSANRIRVDDNPKALDKLPNKKARKPQSRAGRFWGRIGKIALSVFLIGVIAGCLVVGVFAIYVFGFVDGKVHFDLNNLNIEYTTVVYAYDENGSEVEVQRLHDKVNRVWVDQDDISEHLQNAFVAAEDKDFSNHDGVDWKRTFAAFVNMFVGYDDSQFGGSTITQQLVKNLTGDEDKSAMRKIKEIMRARYLEKEYTKPVILTCYINRVYYGSGCYGAEVAANYYFGKSASQLTAAESACLAAIVKNPTRFNPYKIAEGKKYNEDLFGKPDDPQMGRMEYVLFKMHEENYLSDAEYEAAKGEDVKFVDHTSAQAKQNETVINSYFVDAMIDDIVADLMEKYKVGQKYALNMLYTGGYNIYTTLNLKAQQVLETKYKDASTFQKVTGTKKVPESAMCIMDYEGHIVAIVGGRGEKTINRGLNRATMSKRQPGSAMKPIGTYAPALEENLITYSSKTLDYALKMGKELKPKNYGGSNGSNAKVTTQYAIQKSLNTVPVRIVNLLGYDKAYNFLEQKLGITTLVSEDKNWSSLGLGGMQYGLTVKEITAAYSTFGNLGKYWKPTTYTLITSQESGTVLKQQKEPLQAMGEDTANIMNEMLQLVVSKGTATRAAFGGWPIFGKTGTTTDNKDLWFVGGTPHYVAAVWYGFDSYEKGDKTMSGGSPVAAGIWKTIMSELHKDLPLKDFPETSAVTYRRYCTSSGMPATKNCSSTAMGWFKNSYTVACTTHGGSLRDAVSKPAAVTSKAAVSSSSISSSKASASSKSVSSAPKASTAPPTTTSTTPSSQPPVVVPPTETSTTPSSTVTEEPGPGETGDDER